MSDVLVQLKAGDESQPLFLAHGMGGSADEFRDLLKHIHTGRSIYGLQARGNDGLEEPFERIEDLAEYFLNAIKTIQTRGPYFLIGFSLGGIVALEMAQQLSARGESAALLAMMDSYPHPKRLSPWQRIQLALRRSKGRGLSTSPDPTQPFSTSVRPQSAIGRAYTGACTAWKLYRPRFYQGKIYFVRAAISTIYPNDPIAIWGQLASELEVQTVPGDHHGILAENCAILGSLLSEFLRRQIP